MRSDFWTLRGGAVTVAALDLRIYGSDGTVLFDSGMFTPLSFSSTETGTGKVGFVFALDATQAA